MLKTRLTDLGLKPFLKTTGGKGLHVVVPVTPKQDWPFVKEFTKAGRKASSVRNPIGI